MSANDIEVLALDTVKLSDDLRKVLGISPPGASSGGKIVVLGRIPLQAGIGLAVAIGFPPVDESIGTNDLPPLSIHEIGGIVLAPTRAVVKALPDPWHAIALSDLMTADPVSKPAALPVGLSQLESVKQKAILEFSSHDTAAWRLPADASWRELTIQFISDAVVNARFRGETRRFEPEHLSMKDERDGSATVQWNLLRVLAGTVGILHPENKRDRASVIKQKQELSQKLRFHFGITDEPIPFDKRDKHFRTAFVIRGHGLRRSQDENSS